MQGDDLPDSPFLKGKWWRLRINEGEKTKHQLEAYLEEFSGDWGERTKSQFKDGYAGRRKQPWDSWKP